MTSPLSNDLSGRVVQAIEAGECCRSVTVRWESESQITAKRMVKVMPL